MLTVTALLLAATADTMVVPLPEVVVTGTRTVESQLHAPAAISVVGRGSFSNARVISLKDALAGVPGVFVQSRSGAQDVRITIRGYGARGNGERSNTGNIRGIRVMTDGVPVTEPDGRSSLDLVDLGSAATVEVQRSNASALFGNATGGVVNVRTDLGFERPFVDARACGLVRLPPGAGGVGLRGLVPYNGGAHFFTAGRSRRKGFELGLDWLPVSSLTFEGALTVSDNRYLEYRNLTEDFRGDRIAGLPRTSLLGKARYEGPAGVSTEFRIETTGAYFANDANTAQAPAYAILGAT